MDDFRLLVTGDYWHNDFVDLIRENVNAMTLMPFESALQVSTVDNKLKAVVVATSRRGQFDPQELGELLSALPHIPVISLAGSWCEGESRSGTPVPGLIRVYWHQWRGRLNSFLCQLVENQVATWNLPRTYSSADCVLYETDETGGQANIKTIDVKTMIGISTFTPGTHEMLCDLCNSAGADSFWVESTGDEEVMPTPSVVLVDGNSATKHFVDRSSAVRKRFPDATMIAILNFPRRYDFAVAKRAGFDHVVSKPFNLSDVHLLISDCSRFSAA